MQSSTTQAETTKSTDSGSWIGFLAMAFLVVGLVGALATYAAQIPFERALVRNAALDRLVASSQGSAATSPSPQLLDELGDSYAHVQGDAATLPERVAAERNRMLVAFGHESEDFGFRLRIVIAVFTAAAALFGAAILSVVRRAAR